MEMADNYSSFLGDGTAETTPNAPMPSLLTNQVTAITSGQSGSHY
jgi:hypothetical protein